MWRNIRNALYWLAGALLLALPAVAQLQVGDNLDMNLNGVVGVGYSDVFGNPISSSHSLDFSGNGTLSGFYYNPNFVNFSLSPYYNKSSQNSESRSIFDSSGFEFNSGLFGGSHFPGSISYSRSWDSQGSFGIPGAPDYTTRGDGQGFGIGWGAFLPGLPSLSANFNSGSNAYTVFGTDQNGSGSYRSLNLRSNYSIAGFNLNAGYNIGSSHSEIPLIFGNDTLESVHSNNNSFVFSASHNIPVHGSIFATYSHSYVDSDYLGYTFNGTINSVNAGASFAPTQKLSFSMAMDYTDNLAGSLYQSIIPATGSASQTTTGTQQSSGGVLPQTEQSSNALSISAYGAYAVAPNLQVNFQAERRQQSYLGNSYGANTYGAGAIYTRPLLGGSINAAVNFADNTTDTISGNALSFTTNAGYNRRFGDWFVGADASYAQNVQTLLLTYTNSFYIYSGNIRHRFGRFVWSASAGASHSAIVNQPHTGNGGESFSTGLGGRRLTFTASYTKANGYGLLTGNGINLPSGVIPPEWLLMYGGSGYSFGLGASPTRRLTIGANFSRANSNTASGLILSANHSEQMNAYGNYQFRKLALNSGYGRLVQGFSASGVPASEVNSFYIGVSRSFNFF